MDYQSLVRHPLLRIIDILYLFRIGLEAIHNAPTLAEFHEARMRWDLEFRGPFRKQYLEPETTMLELADPAIEWMSKIGKLDSQGTETVHEAVQLIIDLSWLQGVPGPSCSDDSVSRAGGERQEAALAQERIVSRKMCELAARVGTRWTSPAQRFGAKNRCDYPVPRCPNCGSLPAAFEVDDDCPGCAAFRYECGVVTHRYLPQWPPAEVNSFDQQMAAPLWKQLPPSKVSKSSGNRKVEQIPDPIRMTLTEAANVVGISDKSMRDWLNKGKIPHIQDDTGLLVFSKSTLRLLRQAKRKRNRKQPPS